MLALNGDSANIDAVCTLVLTDVNFCGAVVLLLPLQDCTML